MAMVTHVGKISPGNANEKLRELRYEHNKHSQPAPLSMEEVMTAASAHSQHLLLSHQLLLLPCTKVYGVRFGLSSLGLRIKV